MMDHMATDYDTFAEAYAAENEMVELAWQRLGDGADLRVVDLSDPLPHPDDVVAALVLHYLEGWTAPLAELRRVLKPGGRLILAVNHPILYKVIHPEGTTSRPSSGPRSTRSTAGRPCSPTGTGRCTR